MQAFNIWHKLYIHRKKVIFSALFILCCWSSAWSQRQVIINNPHYDEKFISYGFLIGLHTSAYQLKYSDEFVTRSMDSVYSITPKWSGGFSLGFVVNMRISDFLDLRATPKVAFYEHTLEYQRLDLPVIDELVETTVVELPILLKYKSERRGNVRMYFVGGIKPGYEASGKNDIQASSDDNLTIKEFNLSLDGGFGVDLYYPLFKFSPEVRFSKGIQNMLAPGRNEFSAGLDRLNTNTITLYLIFQ